VLGIAPMNKKGAEWKESRVTITISRTKKDGTKEKDKTSEFKATRIRNNVPASLWGQTMDPKDRKSDDPQLLKDAICGYELRLSSPVKPATFEDPTLRPKPPKVDRLEGLGAAWLIEELTKEENSSEAARKIAAGLLDVKVRNRRSKILNDLLPQTVVDWTSATIDSWRGMPGIVKSST